MMKCKCSKTWQIKIDCSLFFEEFLKTSGKIQSYIATLQLSYVVYNTVRNIENFYKKENCGIAFSSFKILLLLVINTTVPRVLWLAGAKH